MNNETVQKEIKLANQALVEDVRLGVKETVALEGTEILNIITEDGYRGYLRGWLMAKGLFDTEVDTSKETNIDNC